MSRWVVVLVLCGLTLSGCSNKSDEAFHSAMTDGIEAVASEDYSKAEVFFEIALEEKSDDSKAKNYLMGIEKLQELLKKQDEGEFEEGLKLSAAIVEDKNTPDAIKKKAKKADEELKSTKANFDENNKLYVEAEQLANDQKYLESNEKLEAIQNKKLENAAYTDLLSKTADLLASNTIALEKDGTTNKETEVQQESSSSKETTAYVSEDGIYLGDVSDSNFPVLGTYTNIGGEMAASTKDGRGYIPKSTTDPMDIAYYRMVEYLRGKGSTAGDPNAAYLVSSDDPGTVIDIGQFGRDCTVYTKTPHDAYNFYVKLDEDDSVILNYVILDNGNIYDY